VLTLHSLSQLAWSRFWINLHEGYLVQPGKPFSIVENTASKRKTEAMVSLGTENRIFGADSFL
jgi:hypothetical protein